MATLATYFTKEGPAVPREERAETPRPRAVPAAADPYRLRALPNEDIYLFAKRIDNSRLLREKDPRAPRECWSAIGALALLAVLLTGALTPTLWGTFAGYQLESLKQEHQRLTDERSRLEVDEATLESPARLERLAHAQKLLQPAPGQVVHLEPGADGALAMNLRK